MLAACGGSGQGEEASIERSRRTEPPVFAAPTTTTTAPVATVDIAPPGPTTSSPTASTSPPTAGSSSVVAPLTPAAGGTYRYATEGQTQFNGAVTPFPPITTLVVDRADGTRQRVTRDLRDPARNGPVFESLFDYRRDGVYLVGLKVSTTVLLVTDVQELRPPEPVLFLPTDAGPGHRRQLEVGGTGITIEVLRREPVSIGSRHYDTSVVRLATHLLGDADERMELTVWLDPATRLWVRERSLAHAASPDRGFSFHSEYHATLLP